MNRLRFDFFVELSKNQTFKPNKANEAADNARYLRSLEPACKPLYAYDPLSMIEHIPNLIKVISNIYQGLCFDRPLY